MTVQVVAALDVGGTHIKSGYLTRDAELLAIRSIATPSSPDAIETRISAEVSRLIAEAASVGLEVVGIGLAVPGLVDEAAGVAVSSMIFGWRQVPFGPLLTRLTGKPVGFGHDVRTAAMAEDSIGAAAAARVFMYVSIGTGLGAAIIVDGTPFTGPRGLSGELAHVVVADEPLCRCGNRGCLEMIASASAIHETYARASGMDVSLPGLLRRLDEGEDLASRVWSHAVGALGRVLAATMEVLDPDVIVIGGGLVEAGEHLLVPLREATQGRVSRQAPPIVAARFGAKAGLVGAGLLGWRAHAAAEEGI